MRAIHFDEFTPPEDWKARAEVAIAAVDALGTEEQKIAYIKAHGAIWRELRNHLIDKFGHKCWFTDAPEYVARLDLEHFRPKAEALDLEGHKREGYWWLAFQLNNFRICGQIPNREHKKCFFPLMTGSFVASSAHRQFWLERPVFLDPIRPADVALVAYAEDGCVHPIPDATPDDVFRVETTDVCFGLSAHQPLVEARQAIWQRCIGLIDEYMSLKEREKANGWDPVISTEQDRALRTLRSLVRPSEPFSSVATSCLLQSPHKWANRLAALPA